MDKFHPLILKKLPKEAIQFLTLLFNKVMAKGKWIWNSSMVSFIRKMDKDSYLVPGSFRPITIASYVSKIMERVLQQRLIVYCQRNNVIDSAQEGFLPQRSTTRYLYKMTASIAEARRKRMSVMLLFMDFEKAFDSISSTAMIYKLSMYGISGTFLRLINNFLTTRSVTLKVNSFIGPLRRTGKFGLPQGSVLSPLLFVIYVSDMLGCAHLVPGKGDNSSAVVFKYADDGTVMVSSKSMTDCFNLMQKICNMVTAWCRRWRLVVNCNKNKTEAITVKNKETAATSFGKLIICGKTIEFVSKSKVLGVVIDDDLSFKPHARTILKRCWFEWHKLSLHTTRKRGLNTSTLSILFKTAVLTKLMYAAPVWLDGNIDVFKGFIAKVLLKISGSQYYSPNTVLQVLFNIPPLSLMLKIMTIKFTLKGLCIDDELKATLFQLEETPGHSFYSHIMMTKDYISWKRGEDTHSARTVQLLELSDDENVYTKMDMQKFMCSKWDRLIVTNDIEHFVDKDDPAALILAETLVNTLKSAEKPIFLREEKRVDNTNTIDFIHERCLRFQGFKYAVSRVSTLNQCLDCSASIDSAAHKLFNCPVFSGPVREDLLGLFKEGQMDMYKLDFLFPSQVGMRDALKKQVYEVCRSSLHDDCYNEPH